MTNQVKPAENAAVITLSDSTVLKPPSRGFIIATSANVTVRMAQNGATILLPNMAAGVIHAIAADQFHATGTGAVGSLVAVW